MERLGLVDKNGNDLLYIINIVYARMAYKNLPNKKGKCTCWVQACEMEILQIYTLTNMKI